MTVAIVGGGIMGISTAYYLARRGIACDVFEASPVMGGLAGPLTLPDGVDVDRFYHAILSSDGHLRDLCEELGIADALRFRETRTAVYIGGGLHTMNSLVELLTFKPLPPISRLRLGGTVAAAQLYRDWRKLETTDVRAWLERLGGRRLFERLWGPMLAAKFDGDPQGIPATWMWSRLVRMKSTRDGANQRERAGHLVGGYATLLAAMAKRITAAGGRILLRTPITSVTIDSGRASGVEIAGRRHDYASVVMTMQGPVASRLMPCAPTAYRARLENLPYLGIVCPLMVLDKPLSNTWTINIADRSIPFTGIIETTSYIDPAFVGGHHLVYVPKYTAPGSPWFTASDAEVKRAWLEGIKRIVPDFSESSIRYFQIHRERFVDPLHRIGAAGMPGIATGIDRLYLATTAQIYPALTNGESVTRHASAAADLVAEGLPAAEGRAALRLVPGPTADRADDRADGRPADQAADPATGLAEAAR
jgi:protoporphyrinogen oxidase